MHAIPAQRVHGHGQHQRGIDSSGEPEQDTGKAILGDVVAHAHHERFVDVILEPRVERSAHRSRHALLQRDERDRFVPARQLLHDVASRIHDERGAVEHELVLAADAIDVDERQSGLARPGADLQTPRLLLARVVGRAVRHRDHLRARFLRPPGRTREPDVLADQETDGGAVDVDDARRASRPEIPLLVEHRVIGELLLAVDRADATVGEHRERVVARTAVAFRKTDDDRRVAHAGGERRELARAGVEKGRTQHEIFRRIPAQRQLGRHDEPRAGALGFTHRRQDRGAVAAEISQHLVQLRDGDVHDVRILPLASMPTPPVHGPASPRRFAILAADGRARENRT